jgi:hypothetical protein
MTASPVIHATRKGASIGLEPIAARMNISRLKPPPRRRRQCLDGAERPYLLLANAIIA